MKRFLIFSLVQFLFVAGCMSDFSLDFGSWGDPYYPTTPPDSSVIYSVSIFLASDTVTYAPGDTAEVSGYAQVRNYYGDPLSGREVNFCVSESSVVLVWDNRTLLNRTDVNGRVNFRLRCTDCAGEVAVNRAHYYDETNTCRVMFLPNDRIPGSLAAFAIPDTIYVDSEHADSVLIGVTILDSDSLPVPGFALHTDYWNWGFTDCYSYMAHTDSTGTASTYKQQYYYGTLPSTYSYSFQVGGLYDAAFAVVMPWDSTHGNN